MKAFTRLGLDEKFLRAGFLKKYGGEIIGACSESGTKFYFKDGYRSQTDHAYQVTRGDFDTHADTQARRTSVSVRSNSGRRIMSLLAAHRAVTKGCLFVTVLALASCATVSHHQFTEPTAGWQTRTGQLMYRSAKATLIGEAVVRISKTGGFELTVSKGPGITLLSLRQDADFAEFHANFTGQDWFGPVAQAPQQLRGWLGLRDQFLRTPNQKALRYVSGNETFLFRF